MSQMGCRFGWSSQHTLQNARPVFRGQASCADITRCRRRTQRTRRAAVYAAAHATEVIDPDERARAWCLLQSRHPNLLDFELPGQTEAAMVKETLRFVSTLDCRKGAGFIEE